MACLRSAKSCYCSSSRSISRGAHGGFSVFRERERVMEGEEEEVGGGGGDEEGGEGEEVVAVVVLIEESYYSM